MRSAFVYGTLALQALWLPFLFAVTRPRCDGDSCTSAPGELIGAAVAGQVALLPAVPLAGTLLLLVKLGR